MADGTSGDQGRFTAPATVATAFVVLFATNGFILAGLTVFDSRMMVALHVSNGALRLRDTATVATLGLSIPFVGYFIDRFNAKPQLIFGLSMMVLAFAGYGHVTAIWQVYALHVLLGLSQAASGVVVCVYLVSALTSRHRGLALGVVMAGSSLGNALVPQINTALLSVMFWREAVGFGAVVALLLIGLVLMVVREPAKPALSPDALAIHGAGFSSLRSGLSSGAFLPLSVIAATTVFCVLALATNLAVFEARRGAAAVGAQLLFGLFGSAVAAQVFAGIAAYRIEPGKLHAAAIALMFVGALGFALGSPGFAGFAIGLFGVGWGANSTMLQVRPTLYFHGPALGRMLALLGLVETIGGGLGPAAVGYVSDLGGGFRSAFILVAALMIAPLTTAVLLRASPTQAAA